MATNKFLRPSDRSYKEVRRTIVRNQKKKAANDEVVVEESYVDSYRSVAVHFGTADLKFQMAKTGMKTTNVATAGPGEPDDAMYLKQAEHLIRRSIFAPAILYLDQALLINPVSKNALSTRARCLLLMGRWEQALQSADEVLETDKTFVKALLVKAEALYNTCAFEHALVLFHRGQALAPDVEEFRLGIQKCRKTIQCTVIQFHLEGTDQLFNDLQSTCEQMSCSTNIKLIAENARQERAIEILNQNSFDQHCATKTDSTEKSKGGYEDEKEELDTPIVQQSTLNPNVSTKIAKPRSRQRVGLASDRLLDDKEYLSRLAGGIGYHKNLKNPTEAKVSLAADEALKFLNARDEFWNQVELTECGF